jgi:hypothetical protein
MALEIVTSWKTLFRLAGESGKAKMAWLENPTPETKQAYDEAKAEHDEYRDMCLKADRVAHLPDIRVWGMSKSTPDMLPKSNDKALDAETRASQWLASANELSEKGQTEKAEEHYRKAQFWLDRYNKLAGNLWKGHSESCF